MKKVKSIAILATMATFMSVAGAYANQTSSATMPTQNFLAQVQSTETQSGFATKLANLVTAGTITQAEADAIQTALDAAKPAGGPGNGGEHKGGSSSVLDSLVTAGTITQTESDAIQTALKAAKPDEATSALAALVTAGTITQVQSDAIQTALDAAKPTGDSGNGSENKGGFSSVLDSFVTAGTITQVQADAIQTTFEIKPSQQ